MNIRLWLIGLLTQGKPVLMNAVAPTSWLKDLNNWPCGWVHNCTFIPDSQEVAPLDLDVVRRWSHQRNQAD